MRFRISGMRSAANAALAGLLVVAGAGCAGMGGTRHQSASVRTLSPARFVHAADRACARGYRANKAIPRATNLTTLVSGLQRAIPALEREIVSLRQLAPPPRDSGSFARVLSDLDAQDVAATRLVDA